MYQDKTVIVCCQEYSLRVQSGCIPDQYHHVTKRYSDFAALDTVLKGYGVDFSLPPKKVFGKMDSDFIEQRQRGLQVFTYIQLRDLRIGRLRSNLESNRALRFKFESNLRIKSFNSTDY